MSKNYVLDSSVYVKLLIPEENAELSKNLFAKIAAEANLKAMAYNLKRAFNLSLTAV